MCKRLELGGMTVEKVGCWVLGVGRGMHSCGIAGITVCRHFVRQFVRSSALRPRLDAKPAETNNISRCAHHTSCPTQLSVDWSVITSGVVRRFQEYFELSCAGSQAEEPAAVCPSCAEMTTRLIFARIENNRTLISARAL